MNDLEGAVAALKKAHSLSPQDPLVLINYAVLLYTQGKGKEVIDILTELNDIMAVLDVDSQVLIPTFINYNSLYTKKFLFGFTVHSTLSR